MSLAEWIIAIIVFVIAGILAIMSVRSFGNRGFLLNNAYIYASEEERAIMDKKPYYRQSAIVFLLLSFVFIIIGISVILQDTRINLLEIPFLLVTFIYAIVSSARIRKRGK